MLFGKEQIRNRVLDEVAICEKEQGFKVIFGSMVGGISKGLQYCDSDYDTRFLYIKKNFPKEIIIPDNIKEKEIIYRKYFSNTPYEWIPFWEFSSFLQFLIHPMIDNKFSVGLYNVVGWTFLSPYVYDPYGIQNKIVPLIQKIFYKEYCIAYHKTVLEGLSLSGESILAKDYIYALHAALSIDWMYKYNEYPPIYMRTLLSIEPSLVEVVEELISTAQKEARNYINSTSSHILHETHYKIYTNHVEEIDNFINKVKEMMKHFKYCKMQQELQFDYRKKIQRIYELVEKTLTIEEKINV